MNLEVNKIAGATLGTLLFVMSLGVVSDMIYSPHKPAKPGYDLPAAEEAPAGGAAQAAVASEPLPVLLAKADPKKGEASAKPCLACHVFEKGGANKVGPHLYGVVERAKGSLPDFAYSEGMKTKGGKWDFADLDTFIANPKTAVAGTKMAYAGEKDPNKRADIVAYLRSLSDNPAPLPK